MSGRPKIGWLDHLANDTQQWYRYENKSDPGGPELKVRLNVTPDLRS
jgi:hypothetical protein